MKDKVLIQRYIEGWKKGSAEEILDVLADDCLIIESHGPTYKGKESVKEWIANWFGKGNRIEKWEMTSFFNCGAIFVSEWAFAYKNEEMHEEFEGITIAKVKSGKIVQLREYRATALPFLWRD